MVKGPFSAKPRQLMPMAAERLGKAGQCPVQLVRSNKQLANSKQMSDAVPYIIASSELHPGPPALRALVGRLLHS